MSACATPRRLQHAARGKELARNRDAIFMGVGGGKGWWMKVLWTEKPRLSNPEGVSGNVSRNCRMPLVRQPSTAPRSSIVMIAGS